MQLGNMNLSVKDFDKNGASLRLYPNKQDIPEEFLSRRNRYVNIAHSLFFKGGGIRDHNLKFKPDIVKNDAHTIIRSWLRSFAPQHEDKISTVAWALSEWTQEL